MEKELEEVRLSEAALRDARTLERQAASAVAAAINRLGAAQRAADNAYQRMKTAAPRESEWHEQVLNPNRGIVHRPTPVGPAAVVEG